MFRFPKSNSQLVDLNYRKIKQINFSANFLYVDMFFNFSGTPLPQLPLKKLVRNSQLFNLEPKLFWVNKIIMFVNIFSKIKKVNCKRKD